MRLGIAGAGGVVMEWHGGSSMVVKMCGRLHCGGDAGAIHVIKCTWATSSGTRLVSDLNLFL